MNRFSTWNLCALLALALAFSAGSGLPAALAGEDEKAPPPPSPEVKLVCKVVTLKHAPCEYLAKTIEAVFDCVVIPYLPTDAVVLRASAEEVKEMEALIAQLDVPSREAEETPPVAQKIEVVPIQHAEAIRIAQVLADSVGAPHQGRGRDPEERPRFTVEERTNSIIVVGSEEQIASALRLIKLLDVPVEKGASPEKKEG